MLFFTGRPRALAGLTLLIDRATDRMMMDQNTQVSEGAEGTCVTFINFLVT